MILDNLSHAIPETSYDQNSDKWTEVIIRCCLNLIEEGLLPSTDCEKKAAAILFQKTAFAIHSDIAIAFAQNVVRGKYKKTITRHTDLLDVKDIRDDAIRYLKEHGPSYLQETLPLIPELLEIAEKYKGSRKLALGVITGLTKPEHVWEYERGEQKSLAPIFKRVEQALGTPNAIKDLCAAFVHASEIEQQLAASHTKVRTAYMTMREINPLSGRIAQNMPE